MISPCSASQSAIAEARSASAWIDHYANFEGVCAAFGRFAAQTRGPLLFCADDLRLAGLLAGHPRAISYGFAPQADYRLALKPPGTSAPGLTSFEVWHAGGKLGDFATALLGEKNVSNAGAVIDRVPPRHCLHEARRALKSRHEA